EDGIRAFHVTGVQTCALPIWGDADVVATTYRRGSTRTSVTAKLESPGAFKQFKAALAADPRLDVDASTTLEYFSKQSEGMTKVKIGRASCRERGDVTGVAVTV